MSDRRWYHRRWEVPFLRPVEIRAKHVAIAAWILFGVSLSTGFALEHGAKGAFFTIACWAGVSAFIAGCYHGQGY